jgi:hypothetical protein
MGCSCVGMCRQPEKQGSLKSGLHGQTVFQAVWAGYRGGGRLAARWQTPKGLPHWGGWYFGY